MPTKDTTPLALADLRVGQRLTIISISSAMGHTIKREAVVKTVLSEPTPRLHRRRSRSGSRLHIPRQVDRPTDNEDAEKATPRKMSRVSIRSSGATGPKPGMPPQIP
ncbi:MAG: hypothetical protein ABR568_00820 [Pyrinomonadaceae bacterium]